MAAVFTHALIAVTYISLVTAVYSGAGKIYFTHYNEYRESGIRIIYRPENYRKYSAVGEGWRAYIGASGYLSEYYAKQNYQEKVLLTRRNWLTLKWEAAGQYYYWDQSIGSLSPGNWFGYGVDIYNADSELIYQDLNHYYQVPSTIEYCELDGDAYSSDTKCSEVLGPRGQKSGGSSAGNQRTKIGVGSIAAAVVVPLVALTAIILAIVICTQRGYGERFKTYFTGRTTTPSNQAAASTAQGVVSPPPAYQPVNGVQQVQSNVSYTAAAPQPVHIIQPQVQTPVHTVHVQPAVVQPTVIAAPAPRVATAPHASSNPLSRITPNHIRTAGALANLFGNAAEAFGGGIGGECDAEAFGECE